jgi:cysteine synthase A
MLNLFGEEMLTVVDWTARTRICETILETVGLTPMVKLRRVVGEIGPCIYGKMEYFSPSGSIKDRILPYIVDQAERRGELKPGMTLIEGSSGNTGIAAAMVGAAKGYRVVIVMPDGMSRERRKVIKAYGAELVLTPGGETDLDLVVQKVAELKAQHPGQMFEVGQFVNKDNVDSHYLTTGPEVWLQTGGEIDIFVAGPGSGGTITGVSKYLKEQRPDVLSFAVEPAECAILSGGGWGSHRVEGIGDGFIPDCLDLKYVDGVVAVPSHEAVETAQRMAKEEGIFCGISSGANVAAAIKVAKEYPQAKAIVTTINDNGLRYLSTGLLGEKKEMNVPERDHPPAQFSDEQRQHMNRLIRLS